MSTREAARARANNQRAAQYTEIWITGRSDDLAMMIDIASRTGRLVYVSAPHPMGGGDPRHRRYLRLRTS
ncbi:hypothetical protein [Salinispora mooreana]|uniref:hypothetical protein n=1 Tax=Salinispora mooreana TaxID=999545 RepID=UPI0002FEA495|nr:hypothetical protein [Salinispora mooreana]